ncbi:hypothetical protein FXO38_36744 [Capsicum annuum]|nr:hypothetical protein FXO38_36744 [Capsicum annuum]KAF3685099.1 hypothetical protein FXO37_00987 [Capsicum annuum]
MAPLYEQKEHNSFKNIARKLQMKKGTMSKSEILASYVEEVKRDLMRNLDQGCPSDMYISSAGHTIESEGDCLAEESQSIRRDEELDLDEYLKRFQDTLE